MDDAVFLILSTTNIAYQAQGDNVTFYDSAVLGVWYAVGGVL
jgi:hypothetical protein